MFLCFGYKLGQKIVTFKCFSNFFRTTGFQLKLLTLIESPNIFHWKPTKRIKVGVLLGKNLSQIFWPNVVKKEKKQVLSIDFFHMLHEEFILKQKVVVVHTPEWKFKANIVRNITSEGRLELNFCPLWLGQKWKKKNDYFQKFYFS